MSELERAQQLLNTIPDYKLGYAISLLQGLAAGDISFNADNSTINTVKLDKAVETAIRNCNSSDKLPDTAYVDSMGVFHPSNMEE